MARKRRRPQSHHAVATIVLVAVAAVVIVAGVVVWQTLAATPKSTIPAGQSVTITIPAGATTKSIAAQLAKAGVVASERRFINSVSDANAGAKLEAGTYGLTTGMPDDVVIDALVAGPVEKATKVTIPEGFTDKQIAARLQKQAGIPASEFLALSERGASQFATGRPYLAKAYGGSLQGYLFPKTYMIKDGATASDVIQMMLDQFDKEIAAVDLSYARSRGLDLNDVVTAASIVEREAKIGRDRPRVASVIYNRLKLGMKLQMCSTVQYILGTDRFRLTGTDIATPSPYNTYLHAGLPPGPIANPGLRALEAAAHPADTKYIYFVLTGKDGSLTFASDYAGFEKANRKSYEVFGQ